MHKKFNTIVGMMALLAIALTGIAQGQGSAWRGADVAAPIKVKYVGTQADTIYITNATASVYVHGTYVPIQGQSLGASTAVSDLVAFFNAATNTSGAKVFKAVVWEALAADLVTNAILSETSIIKEANVWDDPLLWDTHVHLSYDLVPDTLTGAGTAFGNYRINGVFGEPTGTGNVTAYIYLNDAVAYKETFTSPVYQMPATWGGTTDTTLVTQPLVSLGEKIQLGGGVVVGPGSRALVRATRATTATTGGIGASLSRP